MRYTISFMDKQGFARKAAGFISKLDPVELATPTNTAEERSRWLEYGEFANPSFHYDERLLSEVIAWKPDIAKLRRTIDSEVMTSSAADSCIKELLLRRIDETITTIEMAESISRAQSSHKRFRGSVGDIDATTSELIEQKYGRPTSAQVAAAYAKATEGTPYPFEADTPIRDNISERVALEKIPLDAEQVAAWFKAVLYFYGIENWVIEISDRFKRIEIEGKNIRQPIIGIPVDLRVTGYKLIELVGHELESHLLSIENSKSLLFRIMGDDSPLDFFVPIMAKSDDESMYEGQAVRSAIDIGGSAAIPTPYSTIAIDLAKRGTSFGEVAHVIYTLRRDSGRSHGNALSDAWDITYRVFRGSVDPANRGNYAFTKDYVDLAGWKKARNTEPLLLGYSSMTFEEIMSLIEAKIPVDEVAYPNRDATNWVKEKLLH